MEVACRLNGYEASWISFGIPTEISLPSLKGDITPVSTTSSQPNEFALHQNYPNPFNPTTTIAFSLSQPAEVTIAVYDMNGRQVAELFQGRKSAGSHSVTFDAAGLPSGIYIARLHLGERVESMRMVLER